MAAMTPQAAHVLLASCELAFRTRQLYVREVLRFLSFAAEYGEVSAASAIAYLQRQRDAGRTPATLAWKRRILTRYLDLSPGRKPL